MQGFCRRTSSIIYYIIIHKIFTTTRRIYPLARIKGPKMAMTRQGGAYPSLPRRNWNEDMMRGHAPPRRVGMEMTRRGALLLIASKLEQTHDEEGARTSSPCRKWNKDTVGRVDPSPPHQKWETTRGHALPAVPKLERHQGGAYPSLPHRNDNDTARASPPRCVLWFCSFRVVST